MTVPYDFDLEMYLDSVKTNRHKGHLVYKFLVWTHTGPTALSRLPEWSAGTGKLVFETNTLLFLVLLHLAQQISRLNGPSGSQYNVTSASGQRDNTARICC